MNIRSRKFAAVLCLSLGAGSFSTVAGQPTAATPTKPEERIVLDEYVVTGSLIPYAAGVQAVPVRVLDAGEIERTGISTDLADVLRRSQPAFYGANNLGSDVANTNSVDSNGGSGLALRNRS